MATLRSDSGDEMEMSDDALKFMSFHGRRIHMDDISNYFAIAVGVEGGSLIYVPAVSLDALGPEVVMEGGDL